eukprot:123416-Amorphochlora_amoeboformis.AAC.2
MVAGESRPSEGPDTTPKRNEFIEHAVNPALPTSSLKLSLLMVTFMGTSAGMSICNKLAIQAVKLPLVLVAIQSFCSTVAVLFLWSTVKLGTLNDFMRNFLVALCYMMMLISAMIAYNYCSLVSSFPTQPSVIFASQLPSPVLFGHSESSLFPLSNGGSDGCVLPPNWSCLGVPYVCQGE